jgi:hypothetical protein
MTASPVQRLTALLRKAKAVPDLRDEAVAPSSIYDPLYRTMVIALTMKICGKPVVDGGLSLPDPKLKLVQFIAIHPELLSSLRGWIAAHEQGERPSLDGWARFPRGYAADTLHEKVLTYLIATGELRRDGKNLLTRVEGKGLLTSLAGAAEAKQSFAVERDTLHELSGMKITLKMLGA